MGDAGRTLSNDEEGARAMTAADTSESVDSGVAGLNVPSATWYR